MSIEDMHYSNRELAVLTYGLYADKVREELYEILPHICKKEGMYVNVSNNIFPSGLEIEFTKAKKLFAEINFTSQERWTMQAALILTDAGIRADFEPEDIDLNTSLEYLEYPLLQAKKIANNFIYYIKDYYYLAKRIRVERI